MSARSTLANLSVVAGEASALILLAPLEYQTGRYIGLPPETAWTVTGVIYPVTVLAIVVGRLIWAAFGLVWLSGVVGALHAASEAARAEHAARVAHGTALPGDGPAIDTSRVLTSISVVTIVVAAMAVAWWLGREWHRSVAAAAEAEAERQAAERERARAARAQEIERADERRRKAAEMETARRAQEAALAEAARDAEHARNLELLRAQTEAQATTRPARNATARRTATQAQDGPQAGAQLPVRTRKPAARKAPQAPAATAPQTDADLQRRAAAREAAMDTLRSGGTVDTAELAGAYYGTAEPTEQQRNAARAHLSTWRKRVEQERAQAAPADAKEA